jgi:Kef-type K+ transport system membrane component KefB
MSMDLLILPLFSVTAALALLAFEPSRSLNVRFILVLCLEIAGSIVVGLVLGAGLARYIRARGPQLGLVILGLCFVVYRSSQEFGHYLNELHGVVIHLEPLLICAAAGFTVQNLSRQGERLLEAQEGVGLPVYVVFFTMAGAALNMSALAASWAVALLLVGGRLSMIFLGCRVATTLAKDPPVFRNWCWLGFVTQAGLSIALAGQLAAAFGEWGKQLGSLLVAAIAVNQIIGPVAFKFALERAGETRTAKAGLKPEPVEAESPS